MEGIITPPALVDSCYFFFTDTTRMPPLVVYDFLNYIERGYFLNIFPVKIGLGHTLLFRIGVDKDLKAIYLDQSILPDMVVYLSSHTIASLTEL
jgi:hypothetical protein